MNGLNIDWQQIADIGFLLLVTGISLRSLLFDRDALQKQRAVWKKELIDLEGALRELISEATQASDAFDNKIQRRQRDLEAVLNSIEAKVASVTNSSGHFRMEQAVEEDMIDPPWAREEELPRHLRARLESTTDNVYTSDRVKATQTAVPKSAKRVAERAPARPTLKEAIEMEAVENDDAIFQQTSIVDPAAFKIAKRLLLEGKEIHVISRKLDIPVSEIRHLEMLLRKTDLEESQASALKQKELLDVKKVIRDTSNGRGRELSKEAQILESLGLGSYLDELDKETRV